mgnify:CR=1 FL=1
MEKYSKQDDMGKVMDNMRWKYIAHIKGRENLQWQWASDGSGKDREALVDRRRHGGDWFLSEWKQLELTVIIIKSNNEAAELAQDYESWKQKGDLLCCHYVPRGSQQPTSSTAAYISTLKFYRHVSVVGQQYMIMKHHNSSHFWHHNPHHHHFWFQVDSQVTGLVDNKHASTSQVKNYLSCQVTCTWARSWAVIWDVLLHIYFVCMQYEPSQNWGWE